MGGGQAASVRAAAGAPSRAPPLLRAPLPTAQHPPRLRNLPQGAEGAPAPPEPLEPGKYRWRRWHHAVRVRRWWGVVVLFFERIILCGAAVRALWRALRRRRRSGGRLSRQALPAAAQTPARWLPQAAQEVIYHHRNEELHLEAALKEKQAELGRALARRDDDARALQQLGEVRAGVGAGVGPCQRLAGSAAWDRLAKLGLCELEGGQRCGAACGSRGSAAGTQPSRWLTHASQRRPPFQHLARSGCCARLPPSLPSTCRHRT